MTARQALEEAMARAANGEHVPFLLPGSEQREQVREHLLNDPRATAAGKNNMGDPVFRVGPGSVILELRPFAK